MTLPASGTITWNQICAEFGLNAATAIWPQDFYGKGGAPSSGTLSFADFYGRSNVAVTVSIAPTNQDSTGSLASKTFSNCTITVTGGTASSYVWSVSPDLGGGTWAINSGQGTASAAARLTNATTYDNTYSGIIQCVVTVNGVQYTRTATLNYTRQESGGTTMTL